MEQILVYMVQVCICLILAYPVYRIGLAPLTFFNLNRIGILVLVSASFSVPLLSFEMATPIEKTTSYFLQSDLTSSVNNAIPNPEQTGHSFYPLQWILTIYLTGVFLAFARFTYQIMLVCIKIKKSSLTYKSGHILAIHPDNQYSSFFTYIFLPSSLKNSVEEQQVYLHESIHAQQLHSLDVIFLALSKMLLWFNPIIYLFDKSLKEVHEFEADRIVAMTFSPTHYSRLLVDLACKGKTLSVMHNFNYLPIKNRIIMMNKTQSKQRQKARYLLLIPVLAMMSLLFSFDADVNQAKKLTGTWTGTEMVFEQSTGPDISAMIEGGKDLHINGKLVLNKDFSYVIKAPDGEINGNGTWNADNGSSFTTTDQNGEETTYQVLILERNKMVTAHNVQMTTPQGAVKGKIILTYKK